LPGKVGLPRRPADSTIQIAEGCVLKVSYQGIEISCFARDSRKAFFSTYIHSAAPFFGIALWRDGR
jgi:hypothetical protein